MTIAIITQPLENNYGGLLQNWALQNVLKKLNPNVKVITFDQIGWLGPWNIRLKILIHKVLHFNFFRKTPYKFVLRNIYATKKAKYYRDFVKLDKKYKPDLYITGSDQVWRPSMVYDLSVNFLGFVSNKKKIAYAASFGLEEWKFNDAQTKMAQELIKDFISVSVREDSAVKLCQTKLNTKAEHVLDPSMLLNADDYEKLLSHKHLNPPKTTYSFTYILNTDGGKRRLTRAILGDLDEINAGYDTQGILNKNKLSVEDWIANIRNAKMVICDSFHGAAFSIIFNKEFFLLSNEGRGNTRLDSLLRQFGLENRLIRDIEDLSLCGKIDWESVNATRDKLKEKSLSFLRENLQ